MIKEYWKSVRTILESIRPAHACPDKEEFWSDFRARATLVNQETVVDMEPRHEFQIRWTPALVAVAACIMAAIIVAGIVLYPGVNRDNAGVVQYVEVIASHGGVMIMNDEQTDGTILWVMDMKLADSVGDRI